MNKTKKTKGREAELEHAISKLESKMAICYSPLVAKGAGFLAAKKD